MADPNGGILPWWQRIFYLYLASQHLIVAMMQPTIFRYMVVDYWEKAMSTFGEHEHLSPSIKRCISSFRNMWHKVVDVQNPQGPQAAPEMFQDVFQHLGFEIDGQQFFNLDMGDAMSTVSIANLDWNSSNFLDGGESFHNYGFDTMTSQAAPSDLRI